jgi:hypothetical protein
LTRGELRGPAWRRLFHDVYTDARLPVTHLLQCRGAALVLPPGAVLTGRSAACVAGLPLGEAEDPVQVIIPPGRRFRMRGISVRTGPLPAAQVRPGALPITVPQRTAWEIARESNVLEAVVALDVLFHHKHLRPESMEPWTAAHPNSHAAKVLALADGRAESPQETRTRIRILWAGFPSPVPQYEVWREGRHIARLDLAWPAAKVAIEYDGKWHAEFGQFARDQVRNRQLLRAGWRVLHITAGDLADPRRFAGFLDELASALRQAG